MAEEGLKEKIEMLEDDLHNTKVNKKTEMAVGQLKAKISKLKEELEKKLSKGGSRGEGFAVKKEGDATVGLLGKPSVGKSTLLGKITNKESKIGAYEFTTLDVVPGLLHFKHTNLQILDLPGIIDKASDNRGFGKKVLSVVRSCDLVVLVIDARYPIEEIEMLLNETKKANLRFNQKKPFIEIKRTHNGGVKVPLNNSKENIPYDFIKEVINNQGLTNAEAIIHERNLVPEDFVDAVYGNLEYKRAVICMNKIDLFKAPQLKEKIALIKEKYPQFPMFGISADSEINLEEFKEFIWYKLGFNWVYLKEQRREPDMDKPLVVKSGSTMLQVCHKIHKDFVDKFKFAKIRGKSVKFDWQQVGFDHVICDNDLVEIHLK